jgi:cell fate regulator YaaT (PSP1 superfamily)
VDSVVGIRFSPCGKIYCFKADGLELKRGERVVVESDLGVSIGRVVVEDYAPEDPGKELKPVLRRVTEEDLGKEEDNASLKKEALDFCNERIMARGLAMKLLGTDVTLDKRRIIFFFGAETRIDFRELVKDLAAKFRTRIELRQVGVRDAARVVGGMGVCGAELCCRRFLTSFSPISIKMAKRQDLALNTSKLSGICGRLMCCLGYEYEEKPGEERRVSKERRTKEKREVKEMKEAKEEKAPADAPAPVEATAVVETPAPGTPAGEKPPDRRRRQRRRHHGKKHRPPQKGDGEPRAEGKPVEGKPVEGKPVEGKASEEKSAKKPFRRRRKRRMRGKKKE